MKSKILIIEDDPHILLGLEEVLKSDGFDVAVCSRGDQAVDAALKQKPVLIVLDIMLPGLSGYDVCKQLRAKKLTTPIVMLTAKSQEIDKVVGLKELKLLQTFHAHPGEVLSRDRLLSEVWGYNYFGTTRTLDQVIVQLRKKLGDNADEPKHLLTIHGVGYKLQL